MDLEEHYTAMLAFVAEEKRYVDRIARIERRGGGCHPIYGNDEDAAFNAGAFSRMQAFLTSRPLTADDTYESYSALIAGKMGHVMWNSLPSCSRLRDAWEYADFSLGETSYDVFGNPKPEDWAFVVPAERWTAFITALRAKAEQEVDREFAVEAANVIDRFAAKMAGRDAGRVWYETNEAARSADDALGRFYRSIEGEERWNPPAEYAVWKSEAAVYGRAVELLEPLLKDLSSGERP